MGVAAGQPETPWVTIIFKGGAVHTEQYPDVMIYLNKWDRKKIEYVILGGQRIEGNLIEDISGHMMHTKVRYV